MPLPLHCPDCGAKTEPIDANQARCTGCKRDLWANPLPAAGVFIERGNELLLVRRGAEPAMGLWDIPGGFMNEGETPEEAARREVKEELGFDLGEIDLLLVDINPIPAGIVLDVMFTAADPETEPKCADDVTEAKWFASDRFPADLAFPATARHLARWREMRRSESRYRLLGGAQIDLAALTPVAEIAAPFTALPDTWRVECGDWQIDDDLLCGRVDGENPAALWYTDALEGDHVIAFDAHTVSPHSNDINCFWAGSGTILGDGDVACTISGFGGWWNGLSGIERYPEPGLRATGRQIRLTPGRSYRVVAGRKGCTDFLFIDGCLVMQIDDATAAVRERNHVALATWNSHVHYSWVGLYRLPSDR